MGEITFVVIAFVIAMIWMNIATGRIPKTGREGITEGKAVSAVIVNENKAADRCATMKLVGDDGRKYQVKMSPTEAHLWIKGDRVKILISEVNDAKYRVLFNDYFRGNEDRLRVKAKELLEKKVSLKFFAARFVKYTEESLEIFKKSKLESQRLFVFITMMKMLDFYTVFTALFAAVALFLVKSAGGGIKSWFIPFVIVGAMVIFLNSLVKNCVKIKTEAEKSI